MTIIEKNQLVKEKTKPYVIYGVSQEARDILKKLAKEKKVTRGELLNNAIMRIAHMSNVEKTYTNEDQSSHSLDEAKEKLRALEVAEFNTSMYNSHFSSYRPFVLSFGALNQEDMDRKLIEHIYNRLRSKSGKEPILLPDQDKPWWKFWA